LSLLSNSNPVFNSVRLFRQFSALLNRKGPEGYAKLTYFLAYTIHNKKERSKLLLQKYPEDLVYILFLGTPSHPVPVATIRTLLKKKIMRLALVNFT
jgi:hypothetical protein